MPQLQRRLTLFGLTLIAVGSCIGAGIFITPFEIARAVPHGGYILVAWALGGGIALTGALTFAELGGLFPKAGGVYIFLREAYGPLTGFLYGWATLLIINTGSLAALGITFAEYLTFFIPLSAIGKVLIAAAVILGLTLWNIRGVATSQNLSNVFTGLKLAAILGIILIAFMFYSPERGTQTFGLAQEVPPRLPSALLTALIGVLWAFGGWHHASYLAGEAIHPQRTVPRAMLLGALIVTVTYLLVNLGYLLLLTPEQVAASPTVAGDAVGTVLAGSERWIAGAIGISVFGTMAIYTMSAPRIYFAMADRKSVV
jgi:basic amino acid/polyamine antiporter, APA family